MRSILAGMAILLATGAGCASSRSGGQSAPAPVTVLVHNPTRVALLTDVCAPDGCTDMREIRPGRTERFLVPPDPITRLNVTARHGTRWANISTDYVPGEVVRIELSVP